MKMVKTVNTYCPKCKKHVEHSVSLYRKGRDRSVAEGNRRYTRKQEGYGGQRKPKQHRTAKTTKKQTFLLKCNVCNYTIQKMGIRLRKMEINA